MDREELRYLSAPKLISEIEKTETVNFAGVSQEDLLSAIGDMELEVSAWTERNKHLREQRACLHPGESYEDARRRLRNVNMDTPYPQDRARALILKRSKLRQEIAREKERLYVSLVKLEIVNAELEPTREILVALETAREFHRSTGIYDRSAAFLSRLYSECGAGWMDLDVLTAEQFQQIVEVICGPSKTRQA